MAHTLIPNAPADWTPIIWSQAWRRRQYCRRGNTRFRALLGKALLECCCECCSCCFSRRWQGYCWVLRGSHRLLRKLCRLCSAALMRSCALLGPQLGFLFIPCCFDWSDDGVGKPDLHCAVSTAHVRDLRSQLLGPRVEDQFPVAPINRVSTLAAPPWIFSFEFLKLADGAFVSRTNCTLGLHPARAAIDET